MRKLNTDDGIKAVPKKYQESIEFDDKTNYCIQRQFHIALQS